MKYKKGYKYQLVEDEVTKTDIIGYSFDTKFIRLTLVGVLTIKAGYAWDGASGPTIDSPSSMRASLNHDAKYQLLREGLLPQAERDLIDKEFYNDCIEDGMNMYRAGLWYRAVKAFGAPNADPKSLNPVLTAP